MVLDRRQPASPARAGTVLVVDSLDANLRQLQHLLTDAGYAVSLARDGAEAIARIELARPDVVLMDVGMPHLDGFAACAELRQRSTTRLMPVVLMTSRYQPADRIRAIEVGADDFFVKPVDVVELCARLQALVRFKRYTDEVDSAESVILSLAMTVEARDACTDGHCQRLASYGVTLGRTLGLGEEDLAALYRGGYLHDLGKIATPDAILNKPGPLTPDEFEQIKLHPVVGEQLCGNLRVLSRVRPIVRHHHERLDGSGYPDGLVGDAIPLLAQIIGIVDVYDALTTWRPYREAYPQQVAFRHLREEVARGWRSANMVDAFIAAAMRGALDPPGGEQPGVEAVEAS